jgi:nucleoside-diphosphate-sugar epimerase
MLGSGEQRWTTVHVSDLAQAFRLVLESPAARGYYVIGNGLNQTVAEITQAAADAAGVAGAVPGSDQEARARVELGWEPSHPGLVDEFRYGSYRRS